MSVERSLRYSHDPHLRARIQAFSPDEPGAVFPFSARLARENGWSRDRARRVIGEYRRFLYLAMTAGHPVSPSEDVDQAWHLHLTYTRSYWDDLCGRVLGRPFHHEPTRGGRAEGAKFVDWYARTLESYRAAFGHEPPRDVWPEPAARFAPAARVRHVSSATHWVIRKPRPGRLLAAGSALVAVVLAAGCAASGDAGLLMVPLVLFGMLGVVLASAARQPAFPHADAQKKKREDGGGSDGGGGGDWSFGASSDCDAGTGGDCGDGGGGCGGSGCGGGCGGCG